MIVSFFHDTFLIQGTDKRFYSRSFNYEVWERYLRVFDSLIVSTRLKLDNTPNQSVTRNLKLSSGSNVTFLPITAYQKNTDLIFNRKSIINQVRNSLIQSDCAIIRLPSMIGIIAYQEARKLKKKYMIEVVGCAWDAYWNYNMLGKIIAYPVFQYMKNAVKNSQYVIYVTESFLQNRYPTLGLSTNCSNVLLKDFNKDVLHNRIIKIKNTNLDKKIIIGTAADVSVRYKGQQYVIKALSRLKKQGIKNYEYQLVGAGDQSYLKSVAKKYGVADQVKFLGSMKHDKVFDWLNDIDIYVQPSRQEGLPRALIEAMSQGVPSFGAKTAGIPELLEEDYLFSNTKNNIKEINAILQNFTKEKMLLQAKRNFEEAKKYNQDIIEKRRTNFLIKFREDIS